MILMIDNYDSFTYNIVQYMGELGSRPEVVRNDALSAHDIGGLQLDGLVVSPGPCSPSEAGVSCEAIRACADRGIPVFGICLGHQCIGEVFGGKVVHAPYLMHGKVSGIIHDGKGVFTGVPNEFEATRYHSLVIEPESVPSCLDVCAHTADNVIMGIRHKTLPVHGVQFHPESIITMHGHKIIRNFLDIALGTSNKK